MATQRQSYQALTDRQWPQALRFMSISFIDPELLSIDEELLKKYIR